jgi:hypothetical protein
MTIEAWVSPSAVTGGQDLVSKDGEAFDRQYLLLAGSNGFRPHVGTNAGFQYFDGSIVPQSDVWHHVAMTFDGAMLRLFVNGIPDGTMSITGNVITTNQPVRFGGGSAAGDPLFFAGRLDEVRIWNVARSQEEIRTTMDRQLIGTEPGLAAYWSFDEGSGESVYDLSTNGNHGWFVGGPLRVASTAPMQPWWLSWTCDSLVCAAHASREIKLTFDATTKNDGVFLASLIVTSNDPHHRRITIPLKMVVTTAAGVEDEGVIPTEYSLEQNYPNPFNPTTNFGFRISNFGLARISVFDLLGREVAVLVNEEKPPGSYTVTWDASNLPSGIYFSRLTAGGYSQIRKAVLLR